MHIKLLMIAGLLALNCNAFADEGYGDSCQDLHQKCEVSCDAEPCTNPLNDEAKCKSNCKQSCATMLPNCKVQSGS